MKLISAAQKNCNQRSINFRLYLCAFVFLYTCITIAQDPATIAPTYNWEDSFSLPDVTVSRLNSDDINIAVATGPLNYLYILTFGNGVQRRNADGSNVKNDFITGLDSPLDIAVDKEGFIYIADFFAGGETFKDNGQIKVYDPDGNYVRSILTSYFRPMGIDVDDQYLYIAEHNDGKKGPESTPSSRIRIVDKVTGTVIAENSNITIPYRVAVNDVTNKVYVSQAGNGAGTVEIYDQNLISQGRLPNIDSPGSVVVDQFGYIHVIEYSNRVDFEEFIRLSTDFDLGDLLQLSHDIRDGVEDDAFYIKIFNAQEVPKPSVTEKIDFPIDMAFNLCDKMYVDNSKIFGTHIENFFTHSFFPSRLEFEVEVYNRTPAFDLTPPVIACTSNITVQADEGQSSKAVTYALPTATDLCGVNFQRTAGLASGSQFPVGTNSVEYTATDNFGNSASCSFLIIVEATEVDTPPKFENCPSNIKRNNDAGKCGAIVTFDTPTVTDDSGAITPTRTDSSGLNSGDLFPVGETVISYEAADGVNAPVTCSFTIVVTDSEKPQFNNCPSKPVNIKLKEGKSYEIPDYSKIIQVNDNCDTAPTFNQTPAVGTNIQNTTTVNIEITDVNGNSNTCSFEIIVEKVEDFRISCVENYTVILDEAGNAEIPTGELVTSDTSGIEFEISEYSFSCSNIGQNNITIKATKTETGEEASCTLSVMVEDNALPVISCPSQAIKGSIPPDGAYTLSQVIEESEVGDNCTPGKDLVITQSPAPGTQFTEEGDFVISISVTDASGNTETCEVDLQLTKEPTPSFECPEETQFAALERDNNCNVVIPDYRGSIKNIQNVDDPVIEQTVTEELNKVSVILQIRDGEGGEIVGECIFDVEVLDTIPPVIKGCEAQSQKVFINEGSSYTLPDYIFNLEISDNCDPSLGLKQQPEAGTEITESTIVEVVVNDSAGNISSCEIFVEVEVVPEEVLVIDCPAEIIINPNSNCDYIMPDLKNLVNVSTAEAQLSQSISSNAVIDPDVANVTVTATYKDQVETCNIMLILEDNKAPNLECPADIIVQISEGEEYIIEDFTPGIASDNCSEVSVTQDPVAGTVITEDVTVYFEAKDAAGNISSCEATIKIVTDNELEITCPEDKVERFDEQCQFKLPDYREEAVIINGEGTMVTQIPEPGTIIELAEVEVTITVESETESDSCTFQISLEDQTPPILNLVTTLDLPLDTNGRAILTFEDIDTGSFDNCTGEVIYSLDRSDFNCKYLGQNTVQVTAVDLAGNTTTSSVQINVTATPGICSGPVPESDYIFVYPNPNTGNFKVATPANITISRIEVFDHRGRFITSKNFGPEILEYAMDLQPLQEAVYVLKLYTNEGLEMERIIFKY